MMFGMFNQCSSPNVQITFYIFLVFSLPLFSFFVFVGYEVIVCLYVYNNAL